MNKKGQEIVMWALIAIGLGAIILGMYAAVATPARTGSELGGTLVTPVSANEWQRGNKDAKVTLVEYSDFQCPACGFFYGIVKQLEQERGDQVRLVYRHFPLQQHQYARTMAIAAEAAGLQGKFWEMHDMLFEKQDEWSKSNDVQELLKGYASAIGLDTGKFATDLQSQELSDKVAQSVAEGNKQGIRATPTFYLNGKQVEFRTYEELRKLVDEEIGK